MGSIPFTPMHLVSLIKNSIYLRGVCLVDKRLQNKKTETTAYSRLVCNGSNLAFEAGSGGSIPSAGANLFLVQRAKLSAHAWLLSYATKKTLCRTWKSIIYMFNLLFETGDLMLTLAEASKQNDNANCKNADEDESEVHS